MKSYQQLSLNVNEGSQTGKYVPKIQISMVKEIYISKESFKNSAEIAQSEIVEKELRHADREKFICLHLNVKNNIISYEVVSIGNLSSSLVHPREVFKGAILANASSVVFLHNHPSGDPQPSSEDKSVTGLLVKAGDILNIRVLDHIIIAGKTYLSFIEQGLI